MMTLLGGAKQILALPESRRASDSLLIADQMLSECGVDAVEVIAEVMSYKEKLIAQYNFLLKATGHCRKDQKQNGAALTPAASAPTFRPGLVANEDARGWAKTQAKVNSKAMRAIDDLDEVESEMYSLLVRLGYDVLQSAPVVEKASTTYVQDGRGDFIPIGGFALPEGAVRTSSHGVTKVFIPAKIHPPVSPLAPLPSN